MSYQGDVRAVGVGVNVGLEWLNTSWSNSWNLTSFGKANFLYMYLMCVVKMILAKAKRLETP